MINELVAEGLKRRIAVEAHYPSRDKVIDQWLSVDHLRKQKTLFEAIDARKEEIQKAIAPDSKLPLAEMQDLARGAAMDVITDGVLMPGFVASMDEFNRAYRSPRPDFTQFGLDFDYILGVYLVTNPLLANQSFRQHIPELMQRNTPRVVGAVAPGMPLPDQVEMSVGAGFQAASYFPVLERDPSGFELLDQTLSTLKSVPAIRGRIMNGAVTQRVFMAGARFGDKMYRGIYPPGLAPQQ